MQHRHKNELESIEEDKKLQLEAEEREVRRSIIANAASKAAPEPQPAAAPVPHAGAAASKYIVDAPGSVPEDCESCGAAITAKSSKGLNFARLHPRKVCQG